MKEKKVSTATCIISMLLILGTILGSLKLGLNAQMAVLMACVVSILIAFLLKTTWKEIQKDFEHSLMSCMNPMVILILIGVLIGIWMIGGGIASLIYYGLKFVSPTIVVPLTFVLCMATSLFTGTSFGSIATMGLAMFGVGVNLGIPAALMAGAVVAGACWGDKMSPLSDTTNLAPAMAGTDLYSHIYSMFYTTLPATAIAFVLYVVLGLVYNGKGSYDPTEINLLMTVLSENFNINPLDLIPMILLLVLSACKVPAALAMLISVVISAATAIILQGVTPEQVFACGMNGYVSQTGTAMVDKILTRGGAVSMIGTVSSMIFGSLMAGALKASGVLNTLISLLLKMIRSTRSLVITTLCYSYAVLMATGNQMVGILVPGQTMQEIYDDYDVHRKVLSRSLEDAATLGANLIPWTTPAVFAMTNLGVGMEYAPFAFLNYIVPVFSILCATTGIGIWNSKGEPMWKKKGVVH